MHLLALLVVVSASGSDIRPDLTVRMQDDGSLQVSAPVLIQNARVVVRPGEVIEGGSVLLRDGKIAQVGRSISAEGAEVIDARGLTAYAGFIHPVVGAQVEGVSPARNAATGQQAQRARDEDPFGIADSLRIGFTVKDAEKASVSSVEGLAGHGYTLSNLFATGGIVSAEPAIVETGREEWNGKDALNSGMVSLRLFGRGQTGYPRATMGTIAFIRQALADAEGFVPGTEGTDAVGMNRLRRATLGSSKAVFERLTDVSFYQAYNLTKEFGLSPVYEFQSGSGAVRDVLKAEGGEVLLTGSVPNAPRVGEDLTNVRLGQVRSYVNEARAGAELENAEIAFSYSPESTSTPLTGIRTYVRAGLSRDAALAALTVNPARVLGIERDAGTLEAGKRGDLVLFQGDAFDSSSQVMLTFVGGRQIQEKMPERKADSALRVDAPLNLPEANYEPFPKPAESTKAFRLYRNATVWTMGPQGVIEGGDVLIRDGKIVEVGRGLTAPAGCQVIDATGKHISPGVWDAHSHTAIVGGVNEGSQMITVQVRIRDVINHTDTSIYTQLSGGTVGAMQLHGSANAIGGQSTTVKWRWGQKPNDFLVEGAPEGVKFALGQNPIREDSTTNDDVNNLLTFRPRTRFGVEEAIRKALQLGKEYNQAWEDYEAGRTTVKPRRDLQLEGLGEIVSGKRWIHSHGYRQDEMLMLIRVANEYGAKLATLQHVLEGYKIADEMAAAGVGGSTFSDWWGFKLESYDAVPHNAALMAERGVSVSVNSDSNNHARRLNQEAAKSLRYGGVSAEKALSFVTIEPARQLGISHLTGSLEAGKDADLVVWSHAPLEMAAVCLETYVDGVKLFDRQNDLAQREVRLRELGEARRAFSRSGDNPFSTGDDAGADEEATGGQVEPTTARFGLAPVTDQPGTSKYPRTAVLIQGATVHPMVGEPLVADVLIGQDGKIAQVGVNLSSPGATVVDGRGKHVYPGLIDPATGLGLNEIGQVPASDDSSERGDFHPDYLVERAMNPEWSTFGVARHDGILTAIVKPSGSGIPGQAALVHTEGYTWEDLTIQGGVALMYSMGGGGGFFGEQEDTRCQCDVVDNMTSGADHAHHGHNHAHDHDHDHEVIDEFTAGKVALQQAARGRMQGLTQRLEEAQEYAKKRAEATPSNPVARDQKLEAMLRVVEKKLPVMIYANTAADIRAAVAWAEENDIQILLYGCAGAGEIADWLAAKKVPVLLAAVYNIPAADLPVDYFYGLPARLARAGVKFGLTTNNDKDVRQIRDQAGWASAYGLSREDAARSMTLWTAEILGIQHRLGSIQPGLDGTVILTDGEIVETGTSVLRAWVQGREVPLTNRQTQLWDKYRLRPEPNR